MRSLRLPEDFVSFDTEYTTWPGAKERKWGGPDEHREIVQIGAVRVFDLREIGTFTCYVRPRLNPQLSPYFIKLTGISQETIDANGVDFIEAIERFKDWTLGLPLFSWGDDLGVISENALLLSIPLPIPRERATDVRTIFDEHGIDTNLYHSSSIPRAFGEEPPPHAHDALNDARSIVQGLCALRKRIA